MTVTPNPGPADFPRRLEALFEAVPPGLEAPGLEMRILARISVRRRLRAAVVWLAGLIGLGVAFGRLSQLHRPVISFDPIFEVTGNSVTRFLYLSLGAGLPGVAITCGVLTVLGLAFARYLEEV